MIAQLYKEKEHGEVMGLLPSSLDSKTKCKVIVDCIMNPTISSETIITWHEQGHKDMFSEWLNRACVGLTYTERETVIDYLVNKMNYNMLDMMNETNIIISMIVRGGH